MKITILSRHKAHRLKAVVHEDENCRGVFLPTGEATSVFIGEGGKVTTGFTSLEGLLKNEPKTRKPVYEDESLTITF